jgi:hypothetical protein
MSLLLMLISQGVRRTIIVVLKGQVCAEVNASDHRDDVTTTFGPIPAETRRVA